MPYFPPIQELQYPPTSLVQCVPVVIPDGDEFKALLSGLISAAADIYSYADPDSVDADGLAAIWDDALSQIDWSGCVPDIPVHANYVYAGPGSGADASPAFRAILPADVASALTTPPAIGATTPNAGAFTTLTATSTVTLENTQQLRWKDAGGTARRMLDLDSGNNLNINRGNAFSTQIFGLNVYIFDNAVGNMAAFNSGSAGGTVLYSTGNSSKALLIKVNGSGHTGNPLEIQPFSTTTPLMTVTGLGSAAHVMIGAATNTRADALTLGHNSSNTPAAGFGADILTNLKSTTTNNRPASRIKTLWNVPTDAGAIADLVLSAYYNAGGTPSEREGFRVRGGASGPEWSIAGATPGLTETVTGSRGGNAALADLLTKLASKGIIIDGTT